MLDEKSHWKVHGNDLPAKPAVINDTYVFTTCNNGNNTVKVQMGMFDDDHIPNDLAAVDAAICAYYGITTTAN